jgi:hypothetical protein
MNRVSDAGRIASGDQLPQFDGIVRPTAQTFLRLGEFDSQLSVGGSEFVSSIRPLAHAPML